MRDKVVEILSGIAKEKGIEEEELYRQIQRSIDAAFSDPDPKVRKNWNAFPFYGKKPSPEEFIEKLYFQIRTEKEFPF